MSTSPLSISIRSLTIGCILHIAVVFGLSFLFCWGFGAYTLRKATDALMAISFCYLLMGATIWSGRVLRFYHQSAHFTLFLKVTKNDQPGLDPVKRRWLLVFFENQAFIPWVGIGLAALSVAILFGSILSKQYPPDTVLNFLIREDLYPMFKPGGLYRP